MNINDLPSLDSLLKDAEKHAEERANSALQSLKETLKENEKKLAAERATIERNRQLLPALVEICGADAVEYRTGSWQRGHIIIDLGQKPTAQRAVKEWNEKLLAIRHALGVRELKEMHKDVHDAKKRLVYVRLGSDECEGVQIRFIARLPKEAKCRIVAERRRAYTTHSLVCDIQNAS